MTEESKKIKQLLSTAMIVYGQRLPYEEAAHNLNGECGIDEIIRERNKYRGQEFDARMEIYDAIKKPGLTARQYEVVHMHCLQYMSWSQIAERLGIERQSCLNIYARARRRLLHKINTT